ncbi:MAG TPA: ABC transporter substrate-binding protein, partial [Pseudomonadota bacterium]|nr:ABC transporter substrate-binding protein [Pseudomonadota bacterium]
MKNLLRLIALAAVLASGAARAQYTDGIIKIGVMNDMSGTYKDLSGQGSVLAARMAVEDFGAATKGMKVEIVGADHQNKPDVGSNVVRTWIDTDKVDVIVDVPTSSVALAVNEIVRDKNKVFLVSGAAASDLTGPQCTPNTIHWTYDTWALANGTGKAIVKTGGDTWFFITANYAFGLALERDTAAVVVKNGGKVLGQVRHPFPATDFSSFLLQAQASKAKVIGLANAGADTINSIKQASEFGIVQGGQSLAGLLVFITDVKSLGLQIAQGLVLTEAWYWDQNDANREFAKKFAAQNNGIYPSMVHAGVYSAVTHYLKAVEALKSDADGKAVVAKMKEMPTNDKLFGQGTV